MASPRYPVSSISTLFSLTSSRPPILCLWLPSTPRFYPVRDQAVNLPGSTSLLSFISDAAVFPDPLLLTDCGFDPILPLCGRVSRSNGWVLATPRSILGTVLLLMSRDCSWVPAHSRKSSCDHVAAAFQGLWKITAHICHQASPPMTLFHHQRMWLFSLVH